MSHYILPLWQKKYLSLQMANTKHIEICCTGIDISQCGNKISINYYTIPYIEGKISFIYYYISLSHIKPFICMSHSV